MRIIHCADLHLDSKLSANLDRERARQRRAEILHTFQRMVAYAQEHEVDAILIAGDLFDTKNISATARNTVLYEIENHPGLIFYYLRGNHDRDNFLSSLEEIPDNLKLFGSSWTTYECGGVTISGLELNEENRGQAYLSLELDTRKFNVVTLHGQESESRGKDKTEIIDLKQLRNKGIDYLALGHIHSYKIEKLDARGEYCYPGCLEGRGFDECGEHGFVELEIDEERGTYTREFKPFAKRRLYAIEVDVTGCETSVEICKKVENELEKEGCEPESMMKIILIGSLDISCEKDVPYVRSRFEESYYDIKVEDKTTLKINVEDYLLDESLKGEFVRQVSRDEALSEEDRAIVIRYGLKALAGEEVE